MFKSFEEMKARLIAVDTEYQSTESAKGESHLERETCIHKVFCAAFTSASGESWVEWTPTSSYPDILSKAAEKLRVINPVFVNYSYAAEWEAFRRLGDDVEKYPWIDVWLLYRLSINVQGAEWEKHKNAQGLVDACQTVLGVCRDSEHKKAMRDLCITDQTQGHEQEIMDYCLEDTRDLIPMAEKLWEKLEKRMESDKTLFFTPKCRGEKRKTEWLTFSEQIFSLMDSLKAFTRIAHRGLPVNVERLDAIKKGAARYCDKVVTDFVEKYPGAFTFKPVQEATKTATKYVSEGTRTARYSSLQDMISAFSEELKNKSERTRNTACKQAEKLWELTQVKGISGTWHRNDKKCREYLKRCLFERGITKWPLTEKGGELSLDTESLKEEFDDEEGNFGADYLTLSKKTNCLKGIQQEGEKSWIRTLDREDNRLRYQSLRPFAARTGRCQPKASKGFVFAWYKALYCVLEPPKGKWLVELDFTSEETFIQAMVFNDPRYSEIYNSKDMYLWMGVELGMIPRDDFDSMTKSDLKHKYKQRRDRLKTYTLALGYGAGAQKLASKVKLPVETVGQMLTKTKVEVFPHSTAVRSVLQEKILTGAKRCFWLQNGWHTVMPKDVSNFSPNAPLNFPIQGTASVVLQTLVVELEKAGIETLATIHDAIFFMVDEGDTEAIAKASSLMRDVTNKTLGADCTSVKVGDPEIVERGAIWTPEHFHDDEAKTILSYGGYCV